MNTFTVLGTPRPTIDWRGTISYTLIAVAGAWLVVSPLWLSGQGLQHPLAFPLIVAMMGTPALATLIVTSLISKPTEGLRQATGLRLGQRWGRYWLLCWVVVPLLVLAAPFVSAALGLFPLDLSFAGYRDQLLAAGAGAALEELPIGVLVALQLLSGLMLAPLLNALPVFGEEWGWRGYLLPQLLPLGRWPALLLSGVIWGLWHAPVILLGYNYPQHPQLGVLLMVGFCVIWGVLLGWTRLETGSLWPAVIGHAAINGMGGATTLLLAPSASFDSALAGPLGLSGWIAPLLLIAVVVLWQRRRAGPSATPQAAPLAR